MKEVEINNIKNMKNTKSKTKKATNKVAKKSTSSFKTVEKGIRQISEKGYQARISVNGKIMYSPTTTLTKARQYKKEFMKMRVS